MVIGPLLFPILSFQDRSIPADAWEISPSASPKVLQANPFDGHGSLILRKRLRNTNMLLPENGVRFPPQYNGLLANDSQGDCAHLRCHDAQDHFGCGRGKGGRPPPIHRPRIGTRRAIIVISP